jgi:MFS family permease
VLYWAEYKFGWGTLQQRDGLTLMLAMMMVGSLLVNRLIPVIGRNGALLTLFVIESGACVASGLVTTNAHLWVCLAFVGIGLGLFQTLMTMVSAEVSVEDQGRVQGASYCESFPFLSLPLFFFFFLLRFVRFLKSLRSAPHESLFFDVFSLPRAALQTVFWIAGAYLYWYLFDITITDDLYAYYDDDDHVHDVKASLWWWVTAGACAFCAVILSALLANKSSGGLVEKQKKKKRKKGDISGTFSI